jgi:alpha-D-xyloside xylohydrolase
MRALPLEFSSDPKTREISDQFLFGSSLLINPVTTEGATQRSLYLPARSEWIDFWTGKRLSGHQNITAEAPLDRIPIYAKAGAIIPFAPGGPSTSSPAEPVELRLYPGADGDFTLYEDEGDNYNYEHGTYSLIAMHWDDKAEKLTLGDRSGSFPGMLEHRTFHVVLVRDGHGTGIAPSSEPDATINYRGKATSVVLQSRL